MVAEGVHNAFEAGFAGFGCLGGGNEVGHGSLLAGGEGIPEGLCIGVGLDSTEEYGRGIDAVLVVDFEGHRDVVTDGVAAGAEGALRQHEIPAATGRLPGAGEGNVAEEAADAESGLAVEGQLRGQFVGQEDDGITQGAEVVMDDRAFEGVGVAAHAGLDAGVGGVDPEVCAGEVDLEFGAHGGDAAVAGLAFECIFEDLVGRGTRVEEQFREAEGAGVFAFDPDGVAGSPLVVCANPIFLVAQRE